jgi:hypothetical protein
VPLHLHLNFGLDSGGLGSAFNRTNTAAAMNTAHMGRKTERKIQNKKSLTYLAWGTWDSLFLDSLNTFLNLDNATHTTQALLHKVADAATPDLSCTRSSYWATRFTFSEDVVRAHIITDLPVQLNAWCLVWFDRRDALQGSVAHLLRGEETVAFVVVLHHIFITSFDHISISSIGRELLIS